MNKTDFLPCLPLRDIVVFPGMIVPLFVGRDKSIKALNEVMKTNKKIILVTQKNPEIDDPTEKDLYSIGFGAKVKHFQDQPSGELIKNLEPEDLIKYGLIPEFVGRVPILATLKELDENSLVKILKEPKNSLLKQYKKLFEFENVKLTFKDGAVLEIAKKAINKKTGARGLRSIIEALLLKTMFKLPTMEDVEEVVVNESVVKNNREPLIIHSKTKKTSVA